MTRTAADLGQGLAPARDSRAIRKGERIHVLGIAGAGASAAALLARAAGAEVTGCDAGGPSPYSPAVEAAGIPIAWSHDAAHVSAGRPPDRLAVTKALTAVDPDHPELAAARDAGLAIEGWQQLVADAAFGRQLIAVAGTHGKSTTAGWLTWVLHKAGLDPSAFVGALLPASLSGGLPATARVGTGPFVVEADEYAGNFDAYHPDLVLFTTLEWDHPDVFADRAAVLQAFASWLSRDPHAGLVANVGDPGVRDLLASLGGRSGSIVRVAVDAGAGLPDADMVGTLGDVGPAGTEVEINAPLLASAVRASLPTVGGHNAANALVVAAAGRELGIAPDVIADGLASFPGIERRLERKGEARGVVVYDDYGHHPTAIRATIEALRQREPGRRLWAVYEPLTFHRTAAMLDDFASALATADGVVIADIWASRDPDTSITSPQALVERIATADEAGIQAVAPGSVEATASWLAANVQGGDAVLVMGGGHSYRIAELLLEALGAS